MPFCAKLFGKDYYSYKYLVNSKQTFPIPNELIKEFEKQGFLFETRRDFLMKSISSQVFFKNL